MVQGDTLRPYSERARVQTPPLSKILFKSRLTNTRLFTNCECGENNNPEHAANSCKVKISEEEKKIHIKEFKDIFEEEMIDIGLYKQLNNYLNWTIIKIEDDK